VDSSRSSGGSSSTVPPSSMRRCPMTLGAMRHPTLCEVDGEVYEGAAIGAWVKHNGTSPMTRQV
jgi:hypothetical protein